MATQAGTPHGNLPVALLIPITILYTTQVGFVQVWPVCRTQA